MPGRLHPPPRLCEDQVVRKGAGPPEVVEGLNVFRLSVGDFATGHGLGYGEQGFWPVRVAVPVDYIFPGQHELLKFMLSLGHLVCGCVGYRSCVPLESFVYEVFLASLKRLVDELLPLAEADHHVQVDAHEPLQVCGHL